MTTENELHGVHDDDTRAGWIENADVQYPVPDELHERRMEYVEGGDHYRAAPIDTHPGLRFDPNHENFGYNPVGAIVVHISRARSFGKQTGKP